MQESAPPTMAGVALPAQALAPLESNTVRIRFAPIAGARFGLTLESRRRTDGQCWSVDQIEKAPTEKLPTEAAGSRPRGWVRRQAPALKRMVHRRASHRASGHDFRKASCHASPSPVGPGASTFALRAYGGQVQGPGISPLAIVLNARVKSRRAKLTSVWSAWSRPAATGSWELHIEKAGVERDSPTFDQVCAER
jgi:hypothetical protein